MNYHRVTRLDSHDMEVIRTGAAIFGLGLIAGSILGYSVCKSTIGSIKVDIQLIDEAGKVIGSMK